MKRFAIVLLALSSCGSSDDPRATEQFAVPAPGATLPPPPRATKAMTLKIPDDTAQLERLVAMGYIVHEDHLDPPGVASCPKMAENPVM